MKPRLALANDHHGDEDEHAQNRGVDGSDLEDDIAIVAVNRSKAVEVLLGFDSFTG
jgi:hypothetical protein